MPVLGAPGAELPDHRRYVRFRVQINRSVANPHPKRRDDKWNRQDWFLAERSAGLPTPETDAEIVALCNEIARQLYVEIKRRPLQAFGESRG